MRRWPTDVPLALALAASALLHVAALLGPGWALPHEPEPEPLHAVLVTPSPAAKPPAPRPTAPERALPRRAPPAVDAPVPVRDTAPAVAEHAPATPVVPSAENLAPAPPPVAANPAAAPTTAPVAAPSPTISLALPARGEARYRVTRGEGGFVVGQSIHRWEHDGRRYRLQSVTETTGLIAFFRSLRQTQTSQGEVDGSGLRPREYRADNGSRSDTALFDWETGKLAYAGREEALPALTQDLLSMIYQLAALAPERGSLTLPIATGRKLERYEFVVAGTDILATGAGERRAVRIRTLNGGDAIDIWLPADSAQRRGLPLKIRISNRNGDIYDQTLDEIAAP